MALRQDAVKVSRGLSLVIDSLIKRNQNGVADKLIRLQFHATEIMKVFADFSHEIGTAREASQTAGPPPSSSSPVDGFASVDVSAAAAAAAAAAASSVSADTLTTESTKSSIKTPIESDPIGFSALDPDDVKEEPEPVIDNPFADRSAMRERAVPSTQFERAFGFGSLAVRMAGGVLQDRASKLISGMDTDSASSGAARMSEQNAERLAETLCRMRGAALKLGQMLSLQDEGMLPPVLAKALDRVKHSADYMPKHQLENQIQSQLGTGWRSMFAEFDDMPIAAASIGQVHKGVLHDGTEVAVKVQYPGVANSISSDLNNLKRIVSMANLLPPGLFIDQIVHVARTELAWECDYKMEAENQTRYRDLVLADKQLSKHVYVPKVFSDLSSEQVLTTEFVPGVPIDRTANLSQKTRNAIARTALIQTIRELFEWRFIQSDPNFGNFLYDHPTRTVNMIDFGAAREYSKEFVDEYVKIVWAAANKDTDTILDSSTKLGFLTGDEAKEMESAHAAAGLILGEPFLSNEPYDFGNSRLTAKLGSFGDTFLKYRLTPPPTEAYSLHRKLGGAFLLCIRLKAVIPCRDILETTYMQYNFDPVDGKV
jgi:aarF domain-containing kinase